VRYDDAETTLRTMLEKRGVDLDRPDPLQTWTTFKEFAELPVEGVDPEGGDMFLFQWGTYDWHDGNGERFHIDFTRQFVINGPSGEYDHMEQLHCTFYYEANPQVREFGAGEDWIETVSRAESFPVFSVIRDGLATPVGHLIEQEQV
jgi:hypothetical protein